MGKTRVCVCLIALVFAAAALAQQAPAAEATRDVDEIRAEIEAAEFRLEKLHREAEDAERLAERKEEFAEIQERSRDRMNESAERLRDIQTHDEAPTPQVTAFHNACLTYLNAVNDLDKKIQTLKDDAALTEARELERAVEVVETEWYMVHEPTHEHEILLSEMTTAANELARPALLQETRSLRELCDKKAALAQQEFAIWKARRELDRELDKRIDAFWRSVEEAEATAEQ